jgi:SAM-dependent methyltransferase
MVNNSIEIEESRLQGVEKIEDYIWFKDRHRIFPSVFETRQHKKILDSSAGVGCTAKRIKENYPAEIICNDISPTCLKILRSLDLPTVSFNLDNKNTCFPYPEGYFDAIISLVTLEHLMNPDHFLRETHRILNKDGYLYISTPNYAALYYVLRLMLTGKTFHNPLEGDYEFYAHVRYYTFRTLIDLVSSFGFVLDTVYIALPESNTQYRELKSKSPARAFFYRSGRWLMYQILSPRWTAEPIACFQKSSHKTGRKVRKVVL